MPGYEVAYLGGSRAEELSAELDEIDSAVGELVVEAGLEGDCVVAGKPGITDEVYSAVERRFASLGIGLQDTNEVGR